MTSLRTRAVTGGILWAVVTIVLGLAGLASYMVAQADNRFLELLQTRHTQAVVATANNTESPGALADAIGGAYYTKPFSGEYWQVLSSNGDIFTSPSLVDELLPRPRSTETGVSTVEFSGPGDETLIAMREWVSLPDGSLWHVQVASSLDTLLAERRELRTTLLTAFAIVAGVGVLGALTQVYMMLFPLEKLRREVSERWEHESGLSAESYPVEVAPLVTDINTLMERNRDVVSRSRRQAADLAHAIKTPSAIMRNELDTLLDHGIDVQDAVDALDRLDAQLKRSFARMRADGGDGPLGVFTDLDVALGRMDRAFTALARNVERTFSASYTPGMQVRMDQSDVEEVLGNLLDNALKWASSTVRLSAIRTEDQTIVIKIADDGPGIPEDERERATTSGQRLDTSKPGTGLGLAIATDLVSAYGGDIALGESGDLGGLEVTVTLPAAKRRKAA